MRKVANRQTDRQTDKQQRLHILLGGGNYSVSYEVTWHWSDDRITMQHFRRECIWIYIVFDNTGRAIYSQSSDELSSRFFAFSGKCGKFHVWTLLCTYRKVCCLLADVATKKIVVPRAFIGAIKHR